MNAEDKDLLLKDLCGRLPYGVKINVKDDANGLDYDTSLDLVHLAGFGVSESNEMKPYLRPMSSMTEEEKRDFIEYAGYVVEESVNGRHYEYYLIDIVGDKKNPIGNYDAIDWLNKYMFDYRGLIPKGIALEAKEGMYNN